MKKSALFLAAAAAVAASSMALAQSIDVPAGSTDSGVRARVTITPVDTSNLATRTEVNNAYTNAVNWTDTRYSQAISYTQNYRKGNVYGMGVGRYMMDGGSYDVNGICVYGAATHSQAMWHNCPSGTGYLPTDTWFRYTPP